ncbi:hypothetical protein [Epilithonimonas hispanica]|uniref:Uncharacterized protein n=1 Tax=Epilithonimonas hispanica TaxID=358687 RepID=A0A3D9D0E7_9FLAO|nr:hypothetical protein [Epilithonimonas hispanica]REC71381.1 hypothetical protein DRF58_06075 [Epilithonimonas hispanica]
MSLDKLKQTINELIKGNIPIQTVWVTVSEVDWEERTMTAVGIDDEVEFFDVLLGLGSVDLKPKIGSDCLIGIIENQSTSSFILTANELEEIDVVVEECQLNINKGFLLKKENETLAKLMSDLLKEIQKMKFTTNTGSTILLVNKPQFLEIENRFKDFLKTD